MNQQNLNNENSKPLRSQRMTEDEARAVIGLWQQEKTDSGGLTASPAVPDVAEGLDIAIEDVQRLLTQVRAQREEEEHLLTLEQWQVELERIRLAEEERKLAEVQRRRAELRREQSERQRREAAQILPSEEVELFVVPQQAEYNPSLGEVVRVISVTVGTVFLIIFLACQMIAMTGTNSAGGFASDPPGQSCEMDNQPVPCSQIPVFLTQPK